MATTQTQPGGKPYPSENSGNNTSGSETPKQSLHDFLSEEKIKQSALLATIELVHDDDHLVTITPFTDDGCGCDNGFTVHNEQVEWVKKTGQVHYCCGKHHQVVEVGFKEGANISLKELFGPEGIMKRKINPGAYGTGDLATGPMYLLDHIEHRLCYSDIDRHGRVINYYKDVAIYIHRTTGRVIEKDLTKCSGGY